MKRILKLRFTCVLLVLIASLSTHAQIIDNADFEQWTGTCPYNVAPTGWTNFSTSLGPDKAGNCTGSVLPYSGSAHMNLVWYSTTGLLEGASQTIDSFVVGGNYELTFQAINDQGLYSFGDPVFCEVYLNGSVIFTTPELFDGGVWTAYSVGFVASNDTMTIGFKVKNGLSGTSGSLGIDAVGFANLTQNQDLYSKEELILFPCPALDHAQLLIPDMNFKNCSVILLNTLGQQVLQEEIQPDKQSLQFDVSQLMMGTYIAQINIDGTLYLKKLVKF